MITQPTPLGRRILLAALLLVLAGCRGATNPVPLEWKLVWEDEFDGPAGESPSGSRWRYDVGTDWGNAQLEYDTARPENVSLDGAGNLAIIARRETYFEQEFTSARINTRALFEQARGRFEARIKLPRGQGMWPAFWLLGANAATVGWPDCGEIDIMESRGQEPNIILGSAHGPGYSAGNAISTRYTLAGAGFDADFHVFAVEWSQSRITWLVDGTPYRTITPGNLPSGGRWVYDHPFYIILNLAVGGNFVGPPDDSTVFPQAMLVDWVRVYRAEP
jgi:beta-glucanase (GH16 family)